MGTAAAEPRLAGRGHRSGAPRGPAGALVRRAFADGRVRTIGFAWLFAAIAYIQPASYRTTYPTVADRLAFARSFGDNKAVRLFYGEPHDLLTVGGYTAWRVGGTLAIFAAVWGLLAAVRGLRAEEDAGRRELVLAGTVGRGGAYVTSLIAIGLGAALLWFAAFIALVLARLPVGASAYLALSACSVIGVFAGVGALASQLAPTRRLATELSAAVLGVTFVLRVIADTSGGLGWLRWTTPLGWAEELRPFAGGRPAVLLLPVAVSVVLLVVSGRIAARRDVGDAVLGARDSAPPRLWLLSSPTAFALRAERTSLIIWSASLGAFAFIIGVISKSVSSAGISKSLQRELEKLGSGSILSPRGYVGFTSIFFVLVVSLFACAQIAAARHEESEQQLETQLAMAIGRRRWLIGRLGLALGGTVLLALVYSVLGWLGTTSQGVGLSLPRMLLSGVNCLPTAVLFLGLAALAYGFVPRASTGIAYGLVIVAFLWNLFGALLGVPKWVVELTPFEHIGLVPATAFRPGSALAMVAIGVVAGVVALAGFRRRDLLGA
jgi:ABC-2 type transport system permease protein